MDRSADNHHRFARHGRGFWAAVVATLILALSVGCERLSCHDERPEIQPEDTARWAQQTPLANLVPRTARTVVFARDVPTLVEVLSFGERRLPPSGLGRAQASVVAAAGFDPFDPSALEAKGIDLQAPAVIFYDRGFWAVAVGLEDRSVLDEALSKAAARQDMTHDSQKMGSYGVARFTPTQASADEPDEATIWVARDAKSAVIAFDSDPQVLGSDGQAALPQAWFSANQKPRFLDVAQHRDVLGRLTPVGQIVGVVRPSAWFAGRQAPGHAGVLLERLLAQMGPVGFAISAVDLQRKVRVRVLTPGNPGAPVMISDLGSADGDIPPLGGLIEPGVLGVARVSVSPAKLYELFATTLPAEQRVEIERFWDELDAKLRINARRDVLDNLMGHAVVVAYGLDRGSLQAADRSWVLEVAGLNATREAVLLPIHEREPIEQVLDALTTVTKGKLTRQAVGHTLQYAWFDDGELTWALILSDEHLVYVDSDVAFEHAAAFEKRARPLDASLDGAGFTRLFEPADEAAVYLDAASLNSILAETDHRKAGLWLRPFHSVVVTTRSDDSGGVTDIELDIGADRSVDAQ